MGLDVYLYRYENREDTERREAEYERLSEKVWDEVAPGVEYEARTEAQKDEGWRRKEAVAATLGLGKWGDDETGKVCIENPSAKYPDHYFKVGYFRSSYNASGIDHILRDRIGVDLSDIMGAGDDYVFQPDWTASRDRATQALADFRAYIAANGAYRVMRVEKMGGGGPKSEQDALALFLKEASRYGDTAPHPDFDWYGNRNGEFGLTPLKVRGVMQGDGYFGPATYIVYESDTDDFDFYTQALEIVIETCDYVLALPEDERAKHYLHWSA
jgi:hypothetical protein